MALTSLTIPATLEALPQLADALVVFLVNATPDTQNAVLLAVQELAANIVVHGYAGQPGLINAQFESDGNCLILLFHDTAANPYAPSEIQLPNPHDLPEGGWGLFLIHQLVDQVEYQRLPDGNHWKLVKCLELTAE